MLGYINGAHLNRTILNGSGGESLLFGNAFFTQADATSVSAGVVTNIGAATLSQAASALSAEVINAIVAATAMNQAPHTLSAAAFAAIGSSLAVTNDGHGFGGASTGAIAALLDAVGAGDTLQADAEAEAIKAVLDFIQQAQTLSAAGTVLGGVSLDAMLADHQAASAGVLAVAGSSDVVELDDTLASAFKQILLRKALGSDVDSHVYAGQLYPHGPGSGVAPHAGTNLIATQGSGSSLTVH